MIDIHAFKPIWNALSQAQRAQLVAAYSAYDPETKKIAQSVIRYYPTIASEPLRPFIEHNTTGGFWIKEAGIELAKLAIESGLTPKPVFYLTLGNQSIAETTDTTVRDALVNLGWQTAARWHVKKRGAALESYYADFRE